MLYCIVLYCWSLSHVWLSVTPWTVARQAPLPMEFSRQEYWSGLPFLSPEPDSGIKPRSPGLQAESLPSELFTNANLFIPWVDPDFHLIPIFFSAWRSPLTFLAGRSAGDRFFQHFYFQSASVFLWNTCLPSSEIEVTFHPSTLKMWCFSLAYVVFWHRMA